MISLAAFFRKNDVERYRYHLLQMSVNRASTMIGLPSWIIQGLWKDFLA
jgi:hypothetical protein